MIKIDKRLEILMAVIIAYKNINTISKTITEDLDFVEYPNIIYVEELVNKVCISKYIELKPYIESDFDCADYVSLFVYFDDDMNFNNNYKEVFPNLKNTDFAKIIKRIYENESLKDIFIEYKDTLNEIIISISDMNNVDINDCKKFYNDKKYNYNIIVSCLFNGGFSVSDDNTISYLRGICYKDGIFISKEYDIVCLYHEYSHHFVNKLVDKYFDLFKLDSIYEDAIKNGLVKTYQDRKIYLYELIVRSNAEYLACKYISNELYEDDLIYYKKLGFLFCEDIIDLIHNKYNLYSSYEDFFVHEIINFINNK